MEYEKFLAEYQVLCEKYSLFIGACGCCQSPWVTIADKTNTLQEHIQNLNRELIKDQKSGTFR